MLFSALRIALVRAGLVLSVVAAAVAVRPVAAADIDKPASPLAVWTNPSLGADWLTLDRVKRLVPGATRVSPLEGTPPSASVYSGDQLVGYVFVTIDATRSLGFSSLPFVIAVGLGRDAVLTGVEVVQHHEPIIDLIMLQDEVPVFASQYAGVDIRRPMRVRLTKAQKPGTVDGISSATISAVLFNEAILNAARQVARSRGLRLNDQPTVDLISYRHADFHDLVESGAIGHMRLTWDDLKGTAVTDPAVASGFAIRDIYAPKRGGESAVPFEDEPDLLSEIYMAPVMPPTIGRSLLGETWYNLFVSGRDPREPVIAVLSRGPYQIDDARHLSSGPMRRIAIVQDGRRVPLNKDTYRSFGFLHGTDKPRFTEIGMFWFPPEDGIDPLKPMRLELTVEDTDGTDTATFGLDYTLADEFVQQPTGVEVVSEDSGPAWLAVWRTQATNLAILTVALIVLAGILLFMEPLTRRPRLFTALRVGYLAFTLVWLGWIAGAQVTIINVLTWIQAAVAGSGVAVILTDPLIATLMAFVLVTFVVWGRGVFCGWLCPFGAMQELLSKLARVLRLPAVQLSHRTHRMLWPVKYAVLAVLVVVSFHSMADANTAAEVEPFKTAISLRFARAWPYVAYAAVLLGAGLLVERFFCRFLCPLGAAMAIGGKLRLRGLVFLKRRSECGSPCQLCARKCPIQAIAPSGRINMDECFYCLDCQVVYYDEHACPPLVSARKRRARDEPASGAAAPEGAVPEVAARA